MEYGIMEPIKEEVHCKETLCRICASCTELLIPIFEGEGLENNISDKIHKYLPIQVTSEDGFPDRVCFQCASTVISWHELTATCVEAETKLKAMFGQQHTDIQLSSEDPKESSGAISESNPDDMETHQDATVSDPTTLTKVHLSQVSSTSKQDSLTKAPTGGEKERSIADITEDIGVSDDCVEVEEENLSLRDTQVASQSDHSYSQGRPALIQSNPKPPARSPLTSSRTVRTTAPRLILPRPQVNFIATPTIKRMPKDLKKTTFISSPTIVRTPTENKKTSFIASPTTIRTPTGIQKTSANSSKVFVVLERKGPQPGGNGKSVVVAVPLDPSHTTPPSSSQPIILKPINEPQSSSPPAPTTSRPVRVPVTPPARQKAPLPDILKRFPALKDITISRVPADGSKGTFKKPPPPPPPKASVSVIRGGNYTCKLCSQKFCNEMVFKRHMFLSHNIMKHNCPLCKSAFGKKLDLDLHIRQMHRKVSIKTPPQCKYCKQTFDRVMDLKVHIRNKHIVTISRFEQVIRDRKKVLGVEITDKEAEMLREFHSRVDNKDVFNCKICNKSWGNLEKTVNHVRTHTKELLYACETCGQRFNTRGVMIRHTQVHKNVKPYACEYCDKSFSSKQNRDDHHRQHTKEVKTVCESCGEFLTSASMLYYHRKIHSGINPYKCPYCDKAYSIRSLLKRHIRFHTGEKPHLCSVCGRGFKTSGQLRGHSAVHSDARPFSCNVCGTTMKTKKYLRRHAAICTGVRTKPRSKRTKEAVDSVIDLTMTHPGCSASFADFHACRTSCSTCSLPKHTAIAAQVSCAVTLTEAGTKSSSKSLNTVFEPFQDTTTSSDSSDSSDDSYIPPKKLRAVTARKPTRACRVKKEDPVKKQLPHKDVFRCPTCFRQFKRNYDLVRHLENAHPPVKDEPDDQQADEGSGDEDSLPGDKSREFIPETPKSNEALTGPSKKSGNHVTCNNCNGKFRTKEALQRHVTGDGCMMNPTVSDASVEVSVIGDGDSPLNMNAPLDSVPVDVQVKEEDEMPDFPDFQDSDYSLSSEESDMKEEKHRAGPSKERPIFKCEICNKQFKLKESYTTHTRIHTGEKPFTCHMCGKQFSHSGGLSYHLRHVHMGIKEHPCDICGRKFALKAAMQDHRRIHTGERPYVCDVCGKSFKSKASLYIHSKTHTDQFPHPCEYCTKKFRWRQQLLGHLTTHTGEKKHHCKICNKGFGVRNDLTRHERIHSGQKPFKCSLCGLAFGQKRYLKNHLKSRHGILRMDSMESSIVP